MPAFDTESQFKFLIACIKHSQAGRVDFNEVAKECTIVSKGAAAKRYERLMKQHGISSAGNLAGGGGGASGSGNGVKKEAKEPANKSRKKRKLAKVEEDVGDIDEPIKGEVKHEDANVKTELLVKSEDIAGAGVKSEEPSSAASVNMNSEQQQQQQQQQQAVGVDGVSTTITTTTGPPSGASSSSVSSSLTGATTTPQTNDEDDDDEILVVSATERPRNNASVSGFGSSVYDNHHQNPHHQHSHSHSLAHVHAHAHPHSHSPAPNNHNTNGIPGIHSFDYATNMGFPSQLTPPPPPPTTSRTTSINALSSYGFNASGGPWFHHPSPNPNQHSQDTAAAVYGGHHFWQGLNNSTPEHHHLQQLHQHQQHNGVDHDTRMDG